MSLWRALAYFFGEAAINLARSWKVSLLAVVTIAVSLFLGGLIFFVGENLAGMVVAWRQEAKVVVYLRPEESAAPADLTATIRNAAWVEDVEAVTAEEARKRFSAIFPSLTDLTEGWEQEPLPASIEVRVDPRAVSTEDFARWIESLRRDERVSAVDDDRDWLSRLEAVITIVRGVGLLVGSVLLGGAIFTIGAVIRLTAFLFRDEIAVMRLVGATEFFIRGPFYVEGLLQGLLGGLLAAGGLAAGYWALAVRTEGSLFAPFLLGGRPPWREALALAAIGSLAGLVGAVASLRRETVATAEG